MFSISIRPHSAQINLDDSSFVMPTSVNRAQKPQERTLDNERFLVLFQRCFQAAASGNISSCEEVVSAGFSDFNAVGYGPTFKGKSPLKIAEAQGHQHIVHFFQTVMSQPRTYMENLDEDQIYDHLVSRIRVEAPDEELSFLVDKIKDLPLYENPLDSLLEQNAPNREITAQKMALKFPVTEHHLENAVRKQYSSLTVLALLEAAVEQNEGFNAERCLFWLLIRERPYDEETVIKFIHHAKNIDMHYLKAALESEFSNAILEALVEKVQTLNFEISSFLFPNTIANYFEQEYDAYQRQAGDTALTQEFLESYWNRFKDMPKPCLIYPLQYPDTFIKKVLDRLPHPLSYLIGTVPEDIICYFLEKYSDYQVEQFELEHALLCGYSENLILELIKRLEPSARKNQAKEIAEIRGYSEQVLEKLYDSLLQCAII